MRKLEYLKFVEVDSSWRKTRIVEVRSVRRNVLLGTIAWYSQWRQYVIEPEPETIFNSGCLDEISRQLFAMNASHREMLRMRKARGD